ncbi:YjbE family putative metal transport protein [Alphaproteobacteria bacterium]|jgi:YjbE family integral membrane protein|nr:YjbE family putative metal transport protein [Alphaproteobacteria bacterium]MDA9055756.1 YjbE family putative metal transport protein [Alphaproteobacteria bacterium]MDA9131719.1 YjbE family putative metal transport protein [Alphaproteobacteria bacterium]MDA9825107.1 YjbE family putative metal transport protein [Alphaproteobacteria bacterium]MDG2490304.1 YjbE family putative metal transport protein [Alphaproteobacteria bacterium]
MSISGLDISQYGLAEVTDILQIIFADIILSGDNALVIGMAAAGLAAAQRKRAIAIGMAMAAILRILFAIVAAQLLAIKGILLIGGGLLAWVCYRFYHDLKEFNRNNDQALADGEAKSDDRGKPVEKNFGRALLTILVADVSMSIDNIVAVAAIARDNTALLVFGLGLAIAFMAFSASLIMKIMIRYRWLSYLGLWFLIYLTITMLYDGLIDLGLITAIF